MIKNITNKMLENAKVKEFLKQSEAVGITNVDINLIEEVFALIVTQDYKDAFNGLKDLDINLYNDGLREMAVNMRNELLNVTGNQQEQLETVEAEIVTEESDNEHIEAEIVTEESDNEPIEEDAATEESDNEPIEEDAATEESDNKPIEEDAATEESDNEPIEEEIVSKKSTEKELDDILKFFEDEKEKEAIQKCLNLGFINYEKLKSLINLVNDINNNNLTEGSALAEFVNTLTQSSSEFTEEEKAKIRKLEYQNKRLKMRNEQLKTQIIMREKFNKKKTSDNRDSRSEENLRKREEQVSRSEENLRKREEQVSRSEEEEQVSRSEENLRKREEQVSRREEKAKEFTNIKSLFENCGLFR